MSSMRLRALGHVEVSTMDGREEKVEFKLPAKLTQPLAAVAATSAREE